LIIYQAKPDQSNVDKGFTREGDCNEGYVLPFQNLMVLKYF